jgi:hypothetical protein
MIGARAQFRRKGHLHLPALRIVLNEHVAPQNVGSIGHADNLIAALTSSKTATEVQRSAGQPRHVPSARDARAGCS